jgi:hypothetical protein
MQTFRQLELQEKILKLKLETPYHPDLRGLILEYSNLLDKTSNV